MNITQEDIQAKALRCAQQLERIRDTRTELASMVDTFKMFCRQLERTLPEEQRQPITSLIQDIQGELSRIDAINFDDMHYPLDDVRYGEQSA